MSYADYDFYTEQYGGILIDEADFPRLAVRASNYIDQITLNRAQERLELTEVRMCCCALAEQIQAIERAQNAAQSGELKSESVGAYSVSYVTSIDTLKGSQAELYSTAREYLAMTGLLYRGLGICTHRTQ